MTDFGLGDAALNEKVMLETLEYHGRILDVTGDVKALYVKYPLCRVGLRRAMVVAEKRYGETKKADQQ